MKQRGIQNIGLSVLVVSLSSVPLLLTDLYIPAFPQISDYFQTNSTMVSNSMTIFFVSMSIGVLLLGCLSDKYGRKNPLILSSVATTVFSALCAYAPSIEAFLAFRSIQAFGAGGMVAIATAIAKDAHQGKELSRLLAITQSAGMMVPMAAPVLGAFILEFADWRMIFIVIALIMVTTVFGALFFQETLPYEHRTQEGILRALTNMARVAKDKTFSGTLLTGAFLAAPYSSFLAVSSFIYITTFEVSETMFSFYLAAIACISSVGALAYARFNNFKINSVITAFFCVCATVALALLFFGSRGPLVFLVCLIPFTLMALYVRPMITDILLSKRSSDVGAASSLINSAYSIIGSIGMLLGSVQWDDNVMSIGILMIVFMVPAFISWSRTPK